MKTYKYKINGQSFEVTIHGTSDEGLTTVEVNGQQYQVENLEAPKAPKPVVRPKPVAQPQQAAAPAAAPRPSAGGAGNALSSPLPGVILEVKVKEGDTVKIGTPLLVLEAMKMENSIEADRDGVVQKVNVKQGDSVMEGDALVIIGG